MKLSIPDVVTNYFQAANARRPEEAAECFAQDALVHDEARDHVGRAAIREWVEETGAKYAATTVPEAATEAEGKHIVTATVSGNFPGSPIELDYEFTLRDGLISELRIL